MDAFSERLLKDNGIKVYVGLNGYTGNLGLNIEKDEALEAFQIFVNGELVWEAK